MELRVGGGHHARTLVRLDIEAVEQALGLDELRAATLNIPVTDASISDDELITLSIDVGVVQMDGDPAVEIALSGCLIAGSGPVDCGPLSLREGAGEVYVFDVSSAGTLVDLRDRPMDLVTFGADPLDLFGITMYRADTDGAVPDELVVGAFWGDGPTNQRSRAGEFVVISGSP